MTKSNPDDKYILVNLEESDPRIALANATITVSFRIADFGFFCLSCLLYQTLITKILELPDRWQNDFKPVYFDLPFPFRPRPKLKFRVFTMHGGLSVKDLEFSQAVYF